MLDPSFIRSSSDAVRKNSQTRNINPEVIDQWLTADENRQKLLTELEAVRREKNSIARDAAQDEEAREKGKLLRDKEKSLEAEFGSADSLWQELLHQIPNMNMAEVPVGKNEDDNVVVRKVGEPSQFDFAVKDHTELGESLGLLDFQSGAKVAGSQFYYLTGDAVLLELALMRFGLDHLMSQGYKPVITPDLAKSRFYLGTGYAPKGDEAQIYEIEGEDLGLIATAEVTMAGMYADHVFSADELPLKFAAISHCFRKEAGAYGKYSKGLYRVHQFTKLEMFVYCLPEQSEDMHMEILRIEEELLQKLEIPYQVVEMCSGDMGAMAARKFDLEAWMPGRDGYGEVTSTSNTTDFQARNLNIKFKNEDGKNEYVHMLNGTAIVGSRFPVAIFENYQQSDGTIKVPKALVPYMGKEVMS